jgi:hypothetical protein
MQTSMLATGRIALPRTPGCIPATSRAVPQHKGLYKLPSLSQFRHNVGMRCSAAQHRKLAKGFKIVATYPEPETEKERSPIDFPQVSYSIPIIHLSPTALTAVHLKKVIYCT